MIKFLPLALFVMLSCGTKLATIEGTWVTAYSEIIHDGKITPIGGFENPEQQKLIFTKDSMQIINRNNGITGTAQYETRGDTLLIEHGIQKFTFRISEDTLRLIPLLPTGTVTSVYLRE